MDITIIIPVYNRKDIVQRTLNSLPDTFNIIIVDNGSTDGSYEFCRQWMLNSRRRNVRVEREFKAGAAAARNKGLSLCKTKWVYFFDSDDEFTGIPTEWNEQLDMVCFPTRQIIGGKAKIRTYEPVATPHTHILNSMLNTISALYRTEWLRSIGGWNDDCRVWDDWELGVRALIHRPRLEWITEKAYHRVLIHPDSITGANFSERYKQQLDTLGIVFDEIYDMDSSQTKQKCLFALFLRSYIFSGKLLCEGNKEAAAEVITFIYDKFRVNKQSHQLGRLLRWYTSKGGRGAWKIGLKLIDFTQRF